MAYQLTKNLSIGADAQYNFGTIKTTGYKYYTNIQDGTLENNFSRIEGLNITAGLAYEKKITPKHTLFATLVYSPEAKLDFTNERTITVDDQSEEMRFRIQN